MTDKSALWTPALKAELKLETNVNDGKFWMSFTDFTKYFNGVNVCRLFAGLRAMCLWLCVTMVCRVATLGPACCALD